MKQHPWVGALEVERPLLYKKLVQAHKFALHAHEGQTRKYTGDPYIVHPVSVMSTLLTLHPDTTMQMCMAALLHDVVEDCDVTAEDILGNFGEVVQELVEGLTDVSVPSDGNRTIRKRIDREHTASASAQVQIIKCADLIDNTHSIVLHDPGFARIYLEEKRKTLEGMRDEVKSTEIWKHARKICDE